ncbi:MAG: hypothetical protein GY740_13840, partial [Gammaproteobacteria bacterium]|nr:hypothetical protein [Gammaproteobacteria bacterium]
MATEEWGGDKANEDGDGDFEPDIDMEGLEWGLTEDIPEEKESPADKAAADERDRRLLDINYDAECDELNGPGDRDAGVVARLDFLHRPLPTGDGQSALGQYMAVIANPSNAPIREPYNKAAALERTRAYQTNWAASKRRGEASDDRQRLSALEKRVGMHQSPSDSGGEMEEKRVQSTPIRKKL